MSTVLFVIGVHDVVNANNKMGRHLDRSVGRRFPRLVSVGTPVKTIDRLSSQYDYNPDHYFFKRESTMQGDWETDKRQLSWLEIMGWVLFVTFGACVVAAVLVWCYGL